MPSPFSVSKVQNVLPDGRYAARRGALATTHGVVQTPAFMPVGTQATVKTLEPRDLHELRVGMILANTYHLMLRPGNDIVAACGGLHRFMGWDGPILNCGMTRLWNCGSVAARTRSGIRQVPAAWDRTTAPLSIRTFASTGLNA